MTPADRRNWLKQEESRLIRYQHQHRGLNFLKLLLPPTTDRKVNLVGLDNHIYRGSIPRVREDQLPPEVDEKSIDEDALYKEIRDMNFPPVPEHEPLGPSRRVGGSYTLAKKLTLAPVQVEHNRLEENLILGKDGCFYRGTTKCSSTVELDKQLRGSKRPITKMKQARSSDGFVEPTLVTLQVECETPAHGRHQKSIIKLPIAEVGKITQLVKSETKHKKVKIKDSIQESGTEETKDETEPEQSDESKSQKTEETESQQTEQSDESESKQAEQSDESESKQTGQSEELTTESEVKDISDEEVSKETELSEESVEDDDMEDAELSIQTEESEEAESSSEETEES